MTDIILFHHALGLTPGVHALAEQLRAGGHTVHTPDLYDGRLFDSIEDGLAYANGVDTDARADAAIADLPTSLVYAGLSLGVMPAQRLLQNRPGALGGLFYHSFADPTYFGGWPEGVPAQIHAMDADPYFVDEGDLDAARPFVDAHEGTELFLYPGTEHLFTDSSLPGYDTEATRVVVERSLELLDRL